MSEWVRQALVRVRTRDLLCSCSALSCVSCSVTFSNDKPLSESSHGPVHFAPDAFPKGTRSYSAAVRLFHLSLKARGVPETPLTPRLCVFPSRARVWRTEKRLSFVSETTGLLVEIWRWPCAQSVHLLVCPSEHSRAKYCDFTHHCGTCHHSERSPLPVLPGTCSQGLTNDPVPSWFSR